jgi:hypothetical protein
VTTSVLAIDPGLTTGLAWAKFDRAHFYDTLPEVTTEMPREFDATCGKIETTIRKVLPDLIVLEKFTITAATAKKSTAGSSVAIELIGVVKYIVNQYGIKLEIQSPVDAMNFISDEKLRRLGLYKPGLDHARDATRHLLLAAVRHQLLDPALLLRKIS